MRGIKRIFQLLVFAALILGIVQISGATAKADDKSYGIPSEIKGQWEYVGSGEHITSAEAGRTWIWGNAYGKNGYDVIDTNQESYRKANEEVKKNPFMKDTKIVILYLPNCPYSKMYLPLFQQLAGNARAKVMLIDVMKYRTGSLRPYYDAGSIGLTSPGVLYVKPDGTLGGSSAVHSGEEFANILQAAGYTKPEVSEGQSTYTTEQEYKDDVLSETNRQRIAHGLLPLSTTKPLQDVADLRASEIVQKMSHERPNGEMYVSALKEKGITGPNLFGENLAAGPTVATPKAVVNAWMNSPAHRANILNGSYTHMGVGYYNNTKSEGLKYKDNWVQIFAGTCDYDKITLSQSSINVAKGVPIDDMDITVTLHCSTHGDSTMPLIGEMTTGYDPNKTGEQRVVVHYGNKTVPLDVTVGDTEPVEITDSMVKLGSSKVTYNGKAQTPKVTVSNPNGDYALMEGYSYEYSYENNIDAGTATVTVTGKGNYKGTVTKEFTIEKQDISKAKINGLEKSYEYTGKQIKPVPTAVTLDGNTLYSGKDYDIEYGENIGKRVTKPGSPETVEGNVEVTIKGKGNYKGTVSKKDITIDFDDVQRKASQLNLYFDVSNGNFANIYDKFVSLREKALAGTTDSKKYQVALETSIADLGKALNSAISELTDAKGDGLTKLLNCESFPYVQTGIQGYYKYINKYGTKVDGTGKKENVTVKTPDVESKAIVANEVSVEGIENNISANQTAQLQVKDAKIPTKFDETKYEEFSAVPLNIDLKVGDSLVSQGKDKLKTPITITVPVPDKLADVNDLVVLHYADGDSKDPEVLPVTLKDGKISFTTSSFSTFVLAKKLPEYVAPVIEEDQGVNFGEDTTNTKISQLKAPTNIVVTRVGDRDITVDWDKVTDNNTWKTTGYLVTYSTNEDMSDAKVVEVKGADTTKATIKGLTSGDYYVKVATVAASDFNPTGQAQATQLKINIPTIVEDGKKVYLVELPTATQGGTVKSSQDLTSVEEGKQVEFDVTPKAGYQVKSVKVTQNGKNKEVVTQNTNGKYTFKMPASDVNVSVVFEKSNYQVTAADITNGKLEISKPTAQVGDMVTISPSPEKGYKLTQITVKNGDKDIEVKESNGLYSFEMPAGNVAVTATFAKTAFKATIVQPENGMIKLDSEDAVVGTKMQIIATPQQGYKLGTITVTTEDGQKVNVEKDNSFEMPASNVTITATFVKSDYNIIVAEAKNGKVLLDDAKQTAQLGDKVIVRTQADEGYVLSQLNVTDEAGQAIQSENIKALGNGAYEITMPANNIKIEAVFEAKKYSITTEELSNGSLEFNTTNTDMGQNVIITIKPNSGYQLVADSLKVTDGLREITVTKQGDGTYTFIMPAADVKVSAEFEVVIKEDTVTAETTNGSVQFDNPQAKPGETVKATFSAAAGYKLGRMRAFMADGSEISLESLQWTEVAAGVYSFVMPEGAIKFVPEFVKEEVSKPAQEPQINEGKQPAPQRPSATYTLNERETTPNPVTNNAVVAINTANGTQDSTAVTEENQVQEAKETTKKKVKKEKSDSEVKVASEKKTESTSGKSEKSGQHATAIIATSAVVAVAAIGFGIWKFKIK